MAGRRRARCRTRVGRIGKTTERARRLAGRRRQAAGRRAAGIGGSRPRHRGDGQAHPRAGRGNPARRSDPRRTRRRARAAGAAPPRPGGAGGGSLAPRLAVRQPRLLEDAPRPAGSGALRAPEPLPPSRRRSPRRGDLRLPRHAACAGGERTMAARGTQPGAAVPSGAARAARRTARRTRAAAAPDRGLEHGCRGQEPPARRARSQPPAPAGARRRAGKRAGEGGNSPCAPPPVPGSVPAACRGQSKASCIDASGKPAPVGA